MLGALAGVAKAVAPTLISGAVGSIFGGGKKSGGGGGQPASAPISISAPQIPTLGQFGGQMNPGSPLSALMQNMMPGGGGAGGGGGGGKYMAGGGMQPGPKENPWSAPLQNMGGLLGDWADKKWGNEFQGSDEEYDQYLDDFFA